MKQIAIAGLGVVGGGVADLLVNHAAVIEKNAGEEVRLKAVFTRTKKPDSPFASYFVSDFSEIEKDPEIDLVVETIGGCSVALDVVTRALKAGKHVVTANKQLVAEHGLELFALAKANGVNFLFEASVAGGIPVLNPLTRCLGANEITEVSGILNGTTNYILTQMLENGESYADALANAQRLGYAEADPTADVEGIDAARKSCILSGLAFGKNVSPDEIHVEGISKVDALDAQFAEAGGMKIKLLGRTLVQKRKALLLREPASGKVLRASGGRERRVQCRLRERQRRRRGPLRGPRRGSLSHGERRRRRHHRHLSKNPGRMQPAGWEACAEKPAAFSQFHARFYIRVPESEKEAMERQLGKITWLPARAGYLAGITAPIEAGRAIGASPRPASAWPIFE